MDAKEFKDRTMNLGLNVILLVECLPKGKVWTDVVGRQMIRAATSVGANYRAACRAKSPADFIYKMELVEEESDEVAYWLELIERKGAVSNDRLKPLLREANEITAMVVASIKTSKLRGSR